MTWGDGRAVGSSTVVYGTCQHGIYGYCYQCSGITWTVASPMQGWRCPSCLRTWSPLVTSCENCPQDREPRDHVIVRGAHDSGAIGAVLGPFTEAHVKHLLANVLADSYGNLTAVKLTGLDVPAGEGNGREAD